jgi:hypothetical protein
VNARRRRIGCHRTLVRHDDSEIEPLRDVLPQGRESALEALDLLHERASAVPGTLEPAPVAALFAWMRAVVVAQYADGARDESRTG